MHDGEGSVTIPAEVFHALLQKHAPHLIGAEYAVGQPAIDCEGGLTLQVAWSTDCHPTDWAKPPEWLVGRKKG